MSMIIATPDVVKLEVSKGFSKNKYIFSGTTTITTIRLSFSYKWLTYGQIHVTDDTVLRLLNAFSSTVAGKLRWCVAVVDEDRSCTISTAVGSLIYIPRLPKDQRSNEGDTTPRCGSRTNPWIVEAQTGQQVKVSVLDFGLQRQQQQPQRQQASRNDDIVRDHVTARDGDMSKSQDECSVVYGYVIDKSATGINSKNNTICCSGNTSERNRFVYRSKGNIVEIVLHSTPTGSGGYQHKFLIGVEGYAHFIFVSFHNTSDIVGNSAKNKLFQLSCVMLAITLYG